jgi:hypothetical protein
VLALGSSLAHAQSPTCAAPGCNSVASENRSTAMGSDALAHLMTGGGQFFYDTAAGFQALYSNTDGLENSAFGTFALYSNTIGSGNTASGLQALYSNTTGGDNLASGDRALLNNTIGSGNTASGANGLLNNTTGNLNTASGTNALFMNTTGNDNTADGNNALYSNKTGNDNTASGFQALGRNASGIHNTASGLDALFYNNGNFNAAFGSRALFSNISGSNNIAIGFNAGYSITGSNNIDIGPAGSAGESGVIRIGGTAQTAVYIAGITSTHLTGSPVYVGADGQLGVLSSSERYKTEIASMGGSTQKLHELRPVSFHLKSDPRGAIQYGLIAEEVAKVYPELVIRDEAGTIQGVRYDEIAPMLLNEVQQQASQLGELKQQVAALQEVNRRMLVALAELQIKESPVAMR